MARSGDALPHQPLELARKAVGMQPDCGECRAILGWILLVRDWDFRGAEAELDRAIHSNARDSRARLWRAQLWAATGRLEAAKQEIDAAAELDPTSDAAYTMRAGILYFLKRYQEAISEARRAMGINPASAGPHDWVYRSHIRLGRDEDAIRSRAEVVARSMGFSPNKLMQLKQEYLTRYRARGLQSFVEQELREIGTGFTTDILSYEGATLLAWVGDSEGAIAQLERGLNRRPMLLIYAGVDPLFEPMRADKRYRDVLEKIGITESGRTAQPRAHGH